MGIPFARGLVVATGPLMIGVAAAGCNVGFFGGPDRPVGANVLGPPPPAVFQCERGARQVVDEDKDGHAEAVVHTLGSTPVCRGEDTDKDGKLDRWLLYKNEKQIVEEHRDTDRDGTLDRRSRDTNDDGSLDEVTPITR